MKNVYERDYVVENIEYLIYEDTFRESMPFYMRMAVDNFDVDFLKLLLKHGANPEINTWAEYGNHSNEFKYGDRNYGFLHELIFTYHTQRSTYGEIIEKMMKLLLEAGADPNKPGDNNATPIQLCREASEPIKSLLLKYGANPKGNKIY